MIDQELVELCQSSHHAYYRASAFYGGELTYANLPIHTDGSLEFSADAEVKCAGRLTLAKGGESLAPQSKADVLAPFGQEVRIERVDVLGQREWVTVMGQLRIAGIPSMRQYRLAWPNKYESQGWFASLELVDRFDKIRADEFLAPVAPEHSNTTWEEIQRLSNVPIVRADELPDRSLPDGVVYDERSRLDTIALLMAHLGGVPHLTRMGSLTGRVKDAWLTDTQPVVTISGVIDLDDSLSNDVYNAVRVESTSGEFVAVAEITDSGDPLNVNGPLGRRVYRHASPLYASQEAVNEAAQTVLARVSTRRSKTVSVQCLPHPYLELGMVIQVRDKDSGAEVLGEVSRMSFSLNPVALMRLELIVAETQ